MEWRPNLGPQEHVLERSEFEILYGGARGGGKTDAGIVWMIDPVAEPRYRGLVIRKNAEDLTDWIDRANRVFSALGGVMTGKPAVFEFPSGAKIRTGHLKDDNAYTKYQGHEYQRMLIEELTQIAEERRYLMLLASCRSTVPGLKAGVFATTNPGGAGHLWVKERFIDPAPWGTPFRDEDSGRWRIFIPARVEDNPKLMEADPDYVRQLDALKKTDVELWKAWRLGDWDTFAGQFFKSWRRDLHVVKPFTPKAEMERRGGMDWGRTAPFVFLAAAVQQVKLEGGRTFNRCWVFDEIDGTDKTPREWAVIMKERHHFADFAEVRADPAMFTKGQDNSIAISDQFKAEGIMLKPASNDRIGGWSVVNDWLSVAPDGLPYLMVTERCPNLIKTIPSLVHDDIRVEDVDTDGPDHWADALRYLLKHVKWIDAYGGGVTARRSLRNPVGRTAVMIGEKQVAVSLDRWAEKPKRRRR